MKNKILILLIILIGLVISPFNVKAAEKEYNGKKYTTLNLEETLADDEIEESFKSYKETDNMINIYLFRGKGCGYCHAFLEFLNSITEEYGKYFKLVSFEVWYNSDNASLMEEVGEYLEQPAQGVPYIVIGDKVFAGYSSSYDNDIKNAITELYDTKKNKRYDVFEKMKSNPKKSTSENSTSSNSVIIWNLAFMALATIIIMSYISIKFKELNLAVSQINHKLEEKKINENKQQSPKKENKIIKKEQ